MDPIKKAWIFHNWIEDKNEQIELTKNQIYLMASFVNPEAVKKLLSNDGVHTSDDKDFEESLRMVRESDPETPPQEVKKKRRRPKV